MSKAIKIALVVLAIIIFLVVSFAISYVTFGRKVTGEVKELFEEAKETSQEYYG